MGQGGKRLEQRTSLSSPASAAGKPREPTVLAVHSQHIHAEVTGWRTPKGLLLREPVKASFTYTPALAKSALSPQLPVSSDGQRKPAFRACVAGKATHCAAPHPSALCCEAW